MGNILTSIYDEGGRKIRTDINKASSGLGGPDRAVFTFDDMDRVLTGKTQQSAGGGSYTDLTSVTRAYDGFGRLDAETQDGSFALAFAHDEAGAVKEITYPSGSVIVGMRYTLDDKSRPTTIERKLSTAVEGISTSAWETTATIKYLGQREIERVQSLYDLRRTQSWTSFKEPEDLEYKKNSSSYTLKTGLHSIWDADGRMVVRERMHDESGGYEWGEVFRYDRMGRLTRMFYDARNPNSFASSDPVEGTNPYGLRKTWTLGPVYEREDVKMKLYNQTESTAAYSANSHYQVTSGPAAMTWNGNGEMTDRGSDDFAWTAQGQLAQAATSGETARDYSYDAFGRRVKTVVGSQVNRLLYHGWHMIGEFDSTAGIWLWQEAPWISGERMLEHIARDTTDMDSDSNATEYRQYAVHEDFQDTVWGLSGTNAAVAERYNYSEPFGWSDSVDGSEIALGDFATQVFSHKRLHGGFIESEIKLYDYRMRLYMPSTGLWLQGDKVARSESTNRYQFVLLDPLLRVDQYGLSSCPPNTGEAGSVHGVPICVSPRADSEKFEGECAGDDGCTYPDNLEVDKTNGELDGYILIELDCRGMTREACYKLYLHEYYHAVTLANCFVRCHTAKTPDEFAECVEKCEGPDKEESSDRFADGWTDWFGAPHNAPWGWIGYCHGGSSW